MVDPKQPQSQPSDMALMLYPLAGALAGGTAAGVLLSGEQVMNVAFSMDGALGATAGIAVAPYVAQWAQLSGNNAQLAVVAGAVAVPALVSMELDMTTLGIAAGAIAGAYLVTSYM